MDKRKRCCGTCRWWLGRNKAFQARCRAPIPSSIHDHWRFSMEPDEGRECKRFERRGKYRYETLQLGNIRVRLNGRETTRRTQ